MHLWPPPATFDRPILWLLLIGFVWTYFRLWPLMKRKPNIVCTANRVLLSNRIFPLPALSLPRDKVYGLCTRTPDKRIQTPVAWPPATNRPSRFVLLPVASLPGIKWPDFRKNLFHRVQIYWLFGIGLSMGNTCQFRWIYGSIQIFGFRRVSMTIHDSWVQVFYDRYPFSCIFSNTTNTTFMIMEIKGTGGRKGLNAIS